VEIDVGQRGGRKQKTLRAKALGGSQNVCDFASSLAVFYVEQVALNRHVTPPKRLPMIKRENGGKVKRKMKRNAER
jgi:DNA-binding transcriptional regulator YdaS (Cro superfamily)